MSPRSRLRLARRRSRDRLPGRPRPGAGRGASRDRDQRRFRKGQALFHEGGSSDRVVVILLAARVKVSTITEDGKEIVLAFRGPGDLLGELAAIDGEPRSATVEAIEPVEAIAIAAADFRSFLIAHPEVELLLLQMLSRRLRDADRVRVEYGAHDTVGRVAAQAGRARRALRRAGRRRRSDRPAALAGGAGGLDRSVARGGQQGASDPARGRLGAHRAAQDHRPRPRGAPATLGLDRCRPGQLELIGLERQSWAFRSSPPP